MKTMRAKALASLLAGFVTLAGFSGCHASSAAMFSESATISASSAPQDSASSTTQISQTSEAGTYVQDDMTELMPQTYAYFTDLRLSADGAVEVVGLSQSGGIQLLRWTDDVWETAVESSQPAVANRALTVAADGTLWTVCRDDSGAYTLQSGTDPAAMQTIPVEALSQEEALPIGLRLAADGKIFFDRSSRGNHRLCAGRSCHPAGHDRDARFLWQPGLFMQRVPSIRLRPEAPACLCSVPRMAEYCNNTACRWQSLWRGPALPRSNKTA